MDNKFHERIGKLPDLMQKLEDSKFRTRNELSEVKYGGIYVFYDPNDLQALYVGRSDNIKERVQRHSRQSSDHGSATFAFILAKNNAAAEGINISTERKLLEQNDVFKDKFKAAKTTVSNMLVKVVKEENPIIQTLLEVYAAVHLNTPYNDFGNH